MEESRRLSRELIAQGYLNEIVRKIVHSIGLEVFRDETTYFPGPYEFSPDFKQALESLMRTFLPKELELSEEAPAASASASASAAASADVVDAEENPDQEAWASMAEALQDNAPAAAAAAVNAGNDEGDEEAQLNEAMARSLMYF